VAESGARAEADVLLASVDDPLAFRAFYDMWSTQVLAYFQRRVRDPELALELTAETFAVAFEKRGRFRWMGKSPGAWLFGIAKRILFRHLRRGEVEGRAVQRLGIQIPRMDDESTRRIEDLIDGAASRDAVRRALDACRPNDREILQMHIIDEVPYPELAAALGCTVNNARVRVHRALHRLEQHLDSALQSAAGDDAISPAMPTEVRA
jgi:RNA polymerase sigma factor (sigma-70 family)